MVVNGEHEKISIGRVLVSGSTPLRRPPLLSFACCAVFRQPLAFPRVLFAAPSALFFVVAGIVASLPSRAISSQWRRQLDCHWSRGSSLGEEIVISFHGAPRVAMGGDVVVFEWR